MQNWRKSLVSFSSLPFSIFILYWQICRQILLTITKICIRVGNPASNSTVREVMPVHVWRNMLFSWFQVCSDLSFPKQRECKSNKKGKGLQMPSLRKTADWTLKNQQSPVLSTWSLPRKVPDQSGIMENLVQHRAELMPYTQHTQQRGYGEQKAKHFSKIQVKVSLHWGKRGTQN